MKNSLKKLSNNAKLFILHGFGFAFVCFYGAVVHDLARLFNNFLGRMLFPANLCLWEQGKILLTGMSVWFILEYFLIGRKIKGFVYIHTMIAGLLPMAMLLIYLTHSQFFGDLSLEGAHIVLSVVLILSGFMTSVIMLLSKKDYSKFTPYGIVVYVVIVLMYMVFTHLPPKMGMFYDAIHKVYGPYW